ncbi:hypothetical protein ACP70R_036306 [Stipagrostis hirtigluma subsp. patula]
MTGPEASSADQGESGDPSPGCRGAVAYALRMIGKGPTRAAIVVIIFSVALSGFGYDSVGAQIAVESAVYCAIVWLFISTCTSRREKIVSGAFLGVLAAVVVLSAAHSSPVAFLSTGNFIALQVYCIWNWKLYPLAQDWLRRRRARAAAATAPAPPLQLPLSSPPRLEAAECLPGQLQQQATFRIEELPREFSYGELRAITEDFRCKVGRGGSAEVFRGLLDDGTAVAVKRIISDQRGGEAEFLAEVTVLASVQHRSLVRLLGYCLLRGGGRYLVYPFFENRSLDWWLFTGEERRRCLPWPARRRIAVDVARALAYLHHECRSQILHLDIKPANILLDGGLRAHVSDFGVSMSIARDLTSVDTRGRGTPGYMAPEIWDNALSTKSDVYSYGMTLLELVGGRRSLEPANAPASATTPDYTRDFFPCVVRERMARGGLMEVVDAAMARVDQGEVDTVVKAALCCVQHRRDMRPSMATVVDMLEGCAAADLPPESHQYGVDFLESLSSSVV